MKFNEILNTRARLFDLLISLPKMWSTVKGENCLHWRSFQSPQHDGSELR